MLLLCGREGGKVLMLRATCETIQETTRVGGPGRAADLNFLQQSGSGESRKEQQ